MFDYENLQLIEEQTDKQCPSSLHFHSLPTGEDLNKEISNIKWLLCSN